MAAVSWTDSWTFLTPSSQMKRSWMNKLCSDWKGAELSRHEDSDTYRYLQILTDAYRYLQILRQSNTDRITDIFVCRFCSSEVTKSESRHQKCTSHANEECEWAYELGHAFKDLNWIEMVNCWHARSELVNYISSERRWQKIVSDTLTCVIQTVPSLTCPLSIFPS